VSWGTGCMCVFLDKEFTCTLSVLLYGTGPSGKELYNSFHHRYVGIILGISTRHQLSELIATILASKMRWMRLQTTELCLGLIKSGHCNEVVLLKRWP